MTTLNLTLNTSADDGWEAEYGWDAVSASIPLGYATDEGGNPFDAKSAWRFVGVTVPQGATVTSATLTFNKDQANTGTPTVRAYGEAADNSGALGELHRPSVGMTSTAAYGSTTLTAGAGDVPIVFNVTSVVQEIVSRVGWASGNALTFKLQPSAGSGYVFADTASESISGRRPQLSITYSEAAPGTSGSIALSEGADTVSVAASASSGPVAASIAFTSAADTLTVTGSATAPTTAGSIALQSAADTLAIAATATEAAAPAVAIKVAPFFATDVVTQAGFQLYRDVDGVLVADGTHNTAAVVAVPNVTNGYCAILTNELMSLDADGGYRGVIVWDTGGATPQYFSDEVTVAPNAVQLDMTQEVPTTNAAGTVGDALNAARAQGFGKWVKDGTTLTLYGADGSTIVRTFTLDDANAPTSRV